MKPGDKVTIFYAKYLSHEDQLRLRELKFVRDKLS